MSTLEKGVVAVMTVFFIYAAVVQFNDPDPVRWVLIYGVAAVFSGLYLTGRLPKGVPLVVGAAALLWALYLGVRLASRHLFFDEHEMAGIVEEGREMLGLLIVAVWICVMAWRLHHRVPVA